MMHAIACMRCVHGNLLYSWIVARAVNASQYFQIFMNNLFDFISQKCIAAANKTILLILSAGIVSVFNLAWSFFPWKFVHSDLICVLMEFQPAISIIENHSNIITENKMIFDQDNGRPNSNCN